MSIQQKNKFNLHRNHLIANSRQLQSKYPNPTYNLQNHPSNLHPKITNKLNQSESNIAVKKDESFNQMLQIDADQAYKEHRQFLERYKKEREVQLKQKILKEQSNESSSVQSSIIQQNDHKKRCISNVEVYSQANSQNQAVRSYSLQYVQNKMRSIQLKLTKEMNQTIDMNKYKLFTDIVESKNDIQRIAKEKRFIRSQIIKEYLYQEPPMPILNKLPIKFRIKTQSVYNQSQLYKKARNFITRIQNDQQNLLGKHLLRKKIQSIKKQSEQKQQIRKMLQLNDIKRQQRKSKAQQNLMFLKQKVKISQMINFKHLQAINASRYAIGPSFQRFDSVHNTKHHLLESKASKFAIQSKMIERQSQQSQGSLNIKSKIAIRKYKNLRPTQYDEIRQFNQDTTRSNKLSKNTLQDQIFKQIPQSIKDEKANEISSQFEDVYEQQQQKVIGYKNKQQHIQQFKNPYSNIQKSVINIQLPKYPSKQTNNNIIKHKNYPLSSIQ